MSVAAKIYARAGRRLRGCGLRESAEVLPAMSSRRNGAADGEAAIARGVKSHAKGQVDKRNACAALGRATREAQKRERRRQGVSNVAAAQNAAF